MMPTLALWLMVTGVGAGTDRVALNDACVGCHPTEAAQWSGSEHATSFVDEPFQSALLRDPTAFCRGCHAPEQDARETAITPASAIGVACVSCHVEQRAAPRVRDGHLEMKEVVGCDGCHEFGFPDNGLRAHPLAMQSTLTEHAESPRANQSCASCHAPQGGEGRHDHGFAVTRDAEMLARAIEVEVERVAPSQVQVTLRVVGAGHAVPTGDLFRRLEVGATAIGGSSRPSRRWLGRRFATRIEPTGASLVHEIADERLPADGSPRHIVLDIPDAPGRDVVWWVSHQRVAFPRGPQAAGAELDGETPIAGGLLVGASI